MSPLDRRIDDAALLILYQAALIEAAQLGRALGGCHRDTVRHVLRRLTRAGLVRPIAAARHQRRAWALTPAGARAAAQLAGQEPPPPRAWERQLELWRQQARHNLAVVDFFLELARLARPPDQGLTRWYGPRIASRWFPAGGRGRYLVCPDAIGTYVFPDIEIDFYLEMDMGTEPLELVAEKGTRYVEALADRGQLTRRNVAIVTDPPPRAERVHEALRRRLADLGERPNFWIASRSQIAAAGILGQVWSDLDGNVAGMAEWPGFPRGEWDESEFIGHRGPDARPRDAAGRFARRCGDRAPVTPPRPNGGDRP